MRILLLEDHPRLREMTKAHLVERGFVVDAFETVEDGRAALAQVRYDAMVLDLGLPDGDGAQLLTAGPANNAVPALILTARDQVGDRIDGLNAGADDYLVKPVDLGELEARLRAVLRRPGQRASAVLGLGDLTFDTTSREARIRGGTIVVGRREGLLLEALVRAQGRVVVRDLLEESLYGYDQDVTPNALAAPIPGVRRDDQGRASLSDDPRRNLRYPPRPTPDAKTPPRHPPFSGMGTGLGMIDRAQVGAVCKLRESSRVAARLRRGGDVLAGDDFLDWG